MDDIYIYLVETNTIIIEETYIKLQYIPQRIKFKSTRCPTPTLSK